MYKTKHVAELLWVFRVDYPKDSFVKPHSHKLHYQLLFVNSGSCIFSINGERRELKVGSCVLLLPNVTHSIELASEALVTYELKFMLDNAELAEALKRAPSYMKEDQITLSLVPAISQAAEHPESPSNRQACSYFLGSLLYHMALPYFASEADTKELDVAVLADADAECSEATRATIRYINANYMNEITLDKICDTINYNKSYLCHVFKQDMGDTISGYLMRVRVRIAAELIVFSDCTLAQICTRTGFKSVAHFNRIFKKTMGMPPGQYRNAFPEDAMISDLVTMDIKNEDMFLLSRNMMVGCIKSTQDGTNAVTLIDVKHK